MAKVCYHVACKLAFQWQVLAVVRIAQVLACGSVQLTHLALACPPLGQRDGQRVHSVGFPAFLPCDWRIAAWPVGAK